MEKLIDKAFGFVVNGARAYLDVHNLKADDKVLCECIKSWMKINLKGALDDAREAFDCGMSDIAIASFAASMKLAGIEAAKEAGFPK